RVNKKTFNAHFIAYLLNSNFGRQTINNISIEGTRKIVSLGDFKTTKFIFPPLGEAQSIVNALNEKCAQIDLIIFKTNQAIMLIQERRTALISAAVTGKIDLRNWTAPIPEAETPTEVSA
ncbi:TPA: restriction endonuclease subunit S, partial [Escherichia coli]|nr:restriction endonuclease subunit S [Escherichia coli]